jgi:hypothetical protein
MTTFWSLTRYVRFHYQAVHICVMVLYELDRTVEFAPAVHFDGAIFLPVDLVMVNLAVRAYRQRIRADFLQTLAQQKQSILTAPSVQ